MSRFAIAAGMLFGSPPLLAGPAGGVVASGAASITQGANVTNINQSTQKAAINWQGFSVGAGETVNFNQPGASAVTLNRVIGNERSVIAGALNANGKVFLVNSNGVLFTRGSSVSTAGLVASTLNISDEDFQAGRYVFDKGAGAGGGVVNMGTLSAGEGGYIALLGQQVANEGVIVATRGNVALASGDRVVLNFNGDSMLSVSVDQGVLDALVESKGAIYADGGNVILTAKSAGELLDAQVNNSGIIRARTIGDLKGSIDIHAYGGTAAIDGTLDASAPAGGDGGFIETSGNKVRIAEGTVITTAAAAGKTGVWRVDPDGYTIANSGGDISATLLSSLLGSNNITLESTRGSGSGGDLNVNDAVTWGGDTRLTLTATRDVNVNAAITATGEKAGLTLDAGEDINVNADVVLSGANAALAMNYGGDYHILTPATFSGAILDADGKPVANQAPEGTRYASITLSGENASLDINGDAYTLIHSMEQLDALDGYDAALGTGKATAVSGRYAIAQDLDALGTTYVNALLGTSSNSAFSGTLTGLGHTISNLTSRGTAYSYAGLIGYATNVTLRDIGVVKANVETADLWYAGNQGILAGVVSTGSIYNAYTTGTIRGIGTGGLVGGLSNGTLSYAYSDADVFLPDDIPANQAGYGNREGGLAGSVSNAEVSHVHATGYSAAAGLIGSMTGSNVSYAYATGRAAGGGLIGTITIDANHPADVFVTNSFATGDVTGDASIYGGFYAGGLIGYIREPTNANMTYQVVIDNVYATGNVTLSLTKQYAASGVGGLIGAVDQAGSNSHGSISINNAHASGNVTYYGSYAYESDGIQYTSNGNGIVGGLVGDLWSNSSSITNSSATGDVSQVTGTAPTGGLVGRITSSLYSGGNVSTISGSYASGTVTAEGEGYARVGGLVGTDSARTQITSSYFSGRAWTNGTGPVDGIFNTSNGSIGSDVYFNSDNNSSTRGGQGLTSEQFADIAHYLDGTIDQVLSDRAAQAAAQAAAEAAAQAAAQAAAEAQAQAAAQAAAEAQAQAAAQAAAEAQAQAAAQAAAEAQAQAAAQATAQEAAAQQQAVESARLSGLSQARQVAHPGAIDGNIVLADNPSWQSGIQRLGVDGVSLELEKDVTQGK